MTSGRRALALRRRRDQPESASWPEREDVVLSTPGTLTLTGEYELGDPFGDQRAGSQVVRSSAAASSG